MQALPTSARLHYFSNSVHNSAATQQDRLYAVPPLKHRDRQAGQQGTSTQRTRRHVQCALRVPAGRDSGMVLGVALPRGPFHTDPGDTVIR